MLFEHFFYQLRPSYRGGYADLLHPRSKEEIKVGIDEIFVENDAIGVSIFWIRVIRNGVYTEMKENELCSFSLGKVEDLRRTFEDRGKGRISFGTSVLYPPEKPGEKMGPEICD